ncbi:hypothetical protein EC844_102117 [Acinetobacter calcoaceticus]|uniref:Lipoprotein n=1 Tax=Acinetobacter calcoaceticus TaxID=471 RepID=A0A4R1Y3Z1_ACICA|nr:hypothetical protein EC844_102117 [Acinetobacter calcoaceticus]
MMKAILLLGLISTTLVGCVVAPYDDRPNHGNRHSDRYDDRHYDRPHDARPDHSYRDRHSGNQHQYQDQKWKQHQKNQKQWEKDQRDRKHRH